MSAAYEEWPVRDLVLRVLRLEREVVQACAWYIKEFNPDPKGEGVDIVYLGITHETD